MGKIRLLTDEEYERYSIICLNVVMSLDGDVGSFFIYENDGKELLTFRQNDLFTIVTVNEDDSLLLSQFSLDEEYKVIALGMGEYDYYHHNDTDYFVNYKTGIQEQVDFMNRDFEAEKNGIIAYVQYDPMNDSRALIPYNQYKSTPDGEKGFILGHYLKEPDTISFQFNISKKLKQVSYIKQEVPYDVAPTYFNIISVKEYGLEEVLSKGAVALQKSDSITRYFKMIGQKADGIAITGFPFCNVYSYTDMADMILERGFKPKIPQLLIDFYNGNYEPLKYYEQFAEAVKIADKEGVFTFDDGEKFSM